MKLAGIAKPLRSVQLRFMLSGDLSASLERYAKHCEHVDSMDPRAEIVRAFPDADRDFRTWPRSDGNDGP